MPEPKLRPDTIKAALTRLQQVAETTPSWPAEEWRVDRIERRRSTVYRLTDPPTGVRLFYKIFLDLRNQEAKAPDSLVNRLARAQAMSDKLSHRTSGTAISPAPVLTVDTQQRTIVTLGVEGREIRSMTPRSLITGKQLSPTHARLVGEACAHIEQCSDDQQITFDWERFGRQIDHRLRKSDIHIDDAARLRAFLMDTASEVLTDGAPTYIHGDLSPTNVLIFGRQISLIDFSWFTGFKAFDVGLFSYRLRWMDHLLMGRGRALRRSVMAGYQETAGSLNGHPSSLRLVNLLLLVRGLGSRSSRIRQIAYDHLEQHGADHIIEDANFNWWWDYA